MAIGPIQGSSQSLPDDLQSILNELDRTDLQARQLISDLSEAQLNWQPGATAWSIAQCLDHLGQMGRRIPSIPPRCGLGYGGMECGGPARRLKRHAVQFGFIFIQIQIQIRIFTQAGLGAGSSPTWSRRRAENFARPNK